MKEKTLKKKRKRKREKYKQLCEDNGLNFQET